MNLPKKYTVEIDNFHPRMDEVYNHFRDLQIENNSESVWAKGDLQKYSYLHFDESNSECYGGVDAGNGTFKCDPYSVDDFLKILDSKDNDYSIF